jgi:CHAD domain-containing protein
MSTDPQTPGPKKVRITVERDQSAGHTLRGVLGQLLRTADHNGRGISPGADPEYLHQFRVAVRGTRAILPRARELYTTPLVGRLQVELKWIATHTSPARDLDVLSLAIADQRKDMPLDLAQALAPLHEVVKRHAAQEVAVVVDVMSGQRYADLMGAWQMFVTMPGKARPSASRPAKKMAARWIRDRHDHAAKAAKRAAGSDDWRDLHALRISLKKLRYTLTFYRALFPEKPTGTVLQVVRSGQTILGGINDAAVHRYLVATVADETVAQGHGGTSVLLAVGEFRAQLRAQELEHRRHIAAWRNDFLALGKVVRRTFPK